MANPPANAYNPKRRNPKKMAKSIASWNLPLPHDMSLALAPAAPTSKAQGDVSSAPQTVDDAVALQATSGTRNGMAATQWYVTIPPVRALSPKV
jgi:hypothetical protein